MEKFELFMAYLVAGGFSLVIISLITLELFEKVNKKFKKSNENNVKNGIKIAKNDGIIDIKFTKEVA